MGHLQYCIQIRSDIIGDILKSGTHHPRELGSCARGRGQAPLFYDLKQQSSLWDCSRTRFKNVRPAESEREVRRHTGTVYSTFGFGLVLGQFSKIARSDADDIP